MNKYSKEFMDEAIRLAADNVHSGNGGPFGAVVVRNGEIIARGVNMVTALNDPTAHAEVVAIRKACEFLGWFEIKDCELYSSCEPCPMCLGAIYWSRPRAIYFAASREDAAKSGFDDAHIYEEICSPLKERQILTQHIAHENSLKAFEKWKESGNKIPY
ncbi:MAG: nucleoside deaminase [Bacteroidales bacterium]|nr:nucleoside deaminase [Bacteroidales bacterium]